MGTEIRKIDIGIQAPAREKIVASLSHLLADTYTLYLKTHNFHWNVTGPMFTVLHQMFEVQYTELAAAVDLIAERIRTLGAPAPGTYREFQKLANIQEPEPGLSSDQMVAELTGDHESIARLIREALPITQEVNDESTDSLLADRLAVHEKTAWMLRSLRE